MTQLSYINYLTVCRALNYIKSSLCGFIQVRIWDTS